MTARNASATAKDASAVTRDARATPTVLAKVSMMRKGKQHERYRNSG
jgi:hypothetical protein